MPVQSNFSTNAFKNLDVLRKIQANPGTRLGATLTLQVLDQRVFNSNGSKDVHGRLLSKYKKSYMYKRKKNNRGDSRTKILSLTGDMNNQMNVTALGGTAYGVGWAGIGQSDRNGVKNIDKRNWIEEYERTRIWYLSKVEISDIMEDIFFQIKKQWQ